MTVPFKSACGESSQMQPVIIDQLLNNCMFVDHAQRSTHHVVKQFVATAQPCRASVLPEVVVQDELRTGVLVKVGHSKRNIANPFRT